MALIEYWDNRLICLSYRYHTRAVANKLLLLIHRPGAIFIIIGCRAVMLLLAGTLSPCLPCPLALPAVPFHC